MNVYEMIQEHKEEITRDLETINSWKKDGKQLNISALDIMNAIAATVNAINDDIKTAPEIFHAGNGKIDSSVLCQSIAAVLSCGCHCKNCYAANCMTGAHGDNVTLSWYRWYFIEKYLPDIYFSKVRYELSHTKKTTARLHESGDFMDNADAARWLEIMKEFPGIRFYTYTKRDFPAVAEMRELNRAHVIACNIVNSLPCGKINYGAPEYIAALAAAIIAAGKEVHICACGTAAEKDYNKAHKKTKENPGGDNRKYCGGVCKACAYCENVLFYEHK